MLVRWRWWRHLLFLSLILHNHRLFLVHGFHMAPQRSSLGSSVWAKITDMRLCSIVNMHVVVESCPLCECLLTLVATVRSLTTVHSLMSPGGMNNFRVPFFNLSLFRLFFETHIREKKYLPETRASPKSLSTVLANKRSTIGVAPLVGHQRHLHGNNHCFSWLR